MLNKPVIVFIILYFLTSIQLSAQDNIPIWVENKGISPWISENEYVTGFGVAIYDKKNNTVNYKQLAEDNAKKNLAEKIRVNIKSKTSTLKEQSGYHDFRQKLESEIISISDIELLGLKKEYYTDSKKGYAYCFVYVPKSYLTKNYAYKIFEKNKELQNLFHSATQFKNAGQKNTALEYYLKCMPVLSVIKDYNTILLGLGQVPNTNSDISLTDLTSAISKLVTSVNSLNDLAFFIAFVFKEQIKSELSGVIVAPLTYENTGMSSLFSKQFRESLENQLVVYNKWKTFPIKKYMPTIENMNNIRYAVKGSYWELNDSIKINIYVSEILTGIKLASLEYNFKRELAQEEYTPLKPKNFERILGDQAVFEADNLPTGILQIDVYTNKGQEDLIFTEGEKMQVFIKTNLPCYLQMIYHLSDSSRILFINNEYIDISKVNKTYELPFVFTCRPPFGAEILQVNVSEKPFPVIKSHELNGLKYINEELAEILKKSRNVEDGNSIAEKRLTITTMPN